MSEFRCVIGFKVSKLFQKPWYLSDNSEQVIRIWMIMHFKPFNCLVVLNNWIKRSLLQFLPIPAQIVLRVRIEQKQEILNVWNYLLKSEVVSCWVKLVSLLLKFSHTVGCFLQNLCDFLVYLLLVELVLFVNGFLETVILNHPQVFEIHQESSEYSDKLFQFLRVYLCDGNNFLSGKSFLCANEQTNKFLELFLIIEKNLTPEMKNVIKKIFNIFNMRQLFRV